MNEKIEQAIEQLRYGRTEHNDDCLLCAVKDTATNKALALLEAANAEQPEPTVAVEGAVLKPCPFCGRKASLVKHRIHQDRWIVECSRIECRYTYETPIEAVNYWNAPRPSEKEIERLNLEKLEAQVATTNAENECCVLRGEIERLKEDMETGCTHTI